TTPVYVPADAFGTSPALAHSPNDRSHCPARGPLRAKQSSQARICHTAKAMTTLTAQWADTPLMRLRARSLPGLHKALRPFTRHGHLLAGPIQIGPQPRTDATCVQVTGQISGVDATDRMQRTPPEGPRGGPLRPRLPAPGQSPGETTARCPARMSYLWDLPRGKRQARATPARGHAPHRGWRREQ